MTDARRPLSGRVALVAGATRGAGRGIATALGAAGATVYCTGRSSREACRTRASDASPFDLAGRPETIEETADLVTAAGGVGIAVVTDHTVEQQVEALCARVAADHGHLDVLVNDIWGGESLVEWGVEVGALDLAKGRALLDRAVWTHIVTARFATPLLLKSDRPLLVEITDGDSLMYRGQILYDLVKTTVIRLAFALSEGLGGQGLTAVSVTPGFLRSEAMLEHLGVTEETWRDAGAQDPHFLQSETPLYVGRAVAALAADPDVARWSGRALSSWRLARTYGFVDADGRQPDWGRHAEASPFGADQAASHARYVAGSGTPGSGERDR